ncbi:MAG: TetR/AcrR family transcriptional regulator [Phycisphaeraceae bacterium]|nr:TetR/AcrR family transcriptional regulator [Phycisphaeraceae bacterium]
MSQAPLKTAAELFGIRAEPRNARDRLIQHGIDLFYRRGFHAVGLDQLLAEVGVTKTTFYKHFESKDQLILEAIRQRDQWEMAAWRRAVEELAGFDPAAQLLGFFDVLDIWFNDPDFNGCLFLNTAAEFPNPYDPVHQAAADHKRKTRNLFRDLALGAKLRDPEDFADTYTMLFEGTLVLRQVHDRGDAAKRAKAVVKKLITQHGGKR